MIVVKFPPVLDISHWIEVDDFKVLNPKPWLIITKATEADYFLDAKYAEYADGIRDAGIRLGAFHFMRPGDEIKQADWFCEILLDVGLRGNEILACDVEVPDISLNEVRVFNNRVQSRIGIRPIIYSSELQIEDLYPNDICPEWAKEEWFWIAEYPGNPDATSTIPSWIIPHGLTIANIALWQYTDDGRIVGIPGNNVDLNLINPIYLNHIQLTEPTTPTEEPMPIPTQIGTINVSERYIRNGPGVGNSHIATLYANDRVIINDERFIGGYKWYHIVDARRGRIDGQKVITLGGLNVDQRNDCWIYGQTGVTIESTEPIPPSDDKEIDRAVVYYKDGTSQELIVRP